MTDPDRWERTKDLLLRAVERPPDDRRAFLESECGEDEGLLREVVELLAAHEADERFLEEPPARSGADDAALEDAWAHGTPPSVATEAGDPVPSLRVGAYRLVRVIGLGGMGVVYEAERADEQFRKRVAIKFIRWGMDTGTVLRRFRREREILAALEHPNIARLLDGGVTGDGRPYLVMEYVEGRPIDQYCAEEGLGLLERIRLVADVCRAVHMAHRNLVVHRDLKPSNILVDPTGQVKLLDFGVAKILEQKPGDTGSLTDVEGRALTPSYASPEQLRGGPITTATDVYSLGVILYELLTGHRPFEAEGSSFPEMAARVCTEDPVRPSRHLRTGEEGPLQQATRRRLRMGLRGELDHLVLKAIRKEPERRYSSAQELAEDLERFRQGLPVRAAPDSARYRVRKFVERHRAGVAAAAVVTLLLGAAAATTHWQAHVARAERARAQQSFEDIRTLTNALLFELHDAIAPLPGATSARELLVHRAFEYLERLSAQGGNDPELVREVAEGYLRLGRVLGSPSGASLGDLGRARSAFEHALSLVGEGTNPTLHRVTAAATHRAMGDVLAWSGETPGALEHLLRSHALFSKEADAAPEDETAHLEVVVARVKLGDVTGHPLLPNLGDPTGAREWYEEAARALGTPPLAASQGWSVRRYRGLLEERLGTLRRFAGELLEAEAHYVQSLDIRSRLAAEAPAHLDALRDVGVGHQVLCEVRRELGRYDAAMEDCRRALDVYEELHALDPENHQARGDVALGLRSLGRAQEESGDLDGARASLLRVVEKREALLVENGDRVMNRRALAESKLALARVRMALAPTDLEGSVRSEVDELIRSARELLDALRASGIDVTEEEAVFRAVGAG